MEAVDSHKRQKLDEPKSVPAQIYKCTPCNQCFTTRRAYVRHRRENKKHRGVSVTVLEQISCHICGESFARAHDRERHCNEQHFNGKVACTDCGRLIRPNSPHKTSDGLLCSRSPNPMTPKSGSTGTVDLSQCGEFPKAICDSTLDALGESLSQITLERPPMCSKVYKSQVRIAKPNRPLPCGICRMTFEVHDTAMLFDHLKKHFDGLSSKHRCDTCQIEFVNAVDLERHEENASKGDCGFSFLHKSPCEGHHPPAEVRSRGLVLERDNDRFSFCYRVRLWEQCQLQAFVSSIKSLIDTEAIFEHRHSSDTLPRDVCSDPCCRNCGILSFYRQEVGKGKKALQGECRDVKLIMEATERSLIHLTEKAALSTSRRRSSSFSEECPTQENIDVRTTIIESKDINPVRFKLPIGETAPDSDYFTNHWQRIIHQAAASGQVELVTLAIANGADVDGPDLDGQTALHLAASCGSVDVSAALLRAGAQIGPCNAAGEPALSVAIRHGSINAARLLLDHGAMQQSIHEGHKVIFAAFPSRPHGFKVDHPDIDSRNADTHATLYHQYIWKRLPLLVEYGAPLDAVNGDHETALYLAANAGHIDAVQLLLENGAQVESGFDQFSNSLAVSIYNGHFDIAQLLLERGATLQQVSLSEAIKAGADVAFIAMLLDKGVNNHEVKPYCTPPLVVACKAGNIDIIRLLIERGAAVNPVTSVSSHNPLVAGAKAGRTDVINFLLESGAKIDTQIGQYSVGFIAMHEAARKGQTAVLQVLLEQGCEVTDHCYDSHSLLCNAVSYGHLECTRYIVENGMDLEAMCESQHTALMWAGHRCQSAIEEYLISKGVKATTQDGGQSALSHGLSENGLDNEPFGLNLRLYREKRSDASSLVQNPRLFRSR